MARVTVIRDDLDGSEPAEEVEFTWDGVNRTIDLSEANRKKLEELLQPYIEHSRVRQAPTDAERAEAEPQRKRGRAGARRGIPVEEYGFPRRGRVSTEEAEYVRQHLDEVNKRLRAAGKREIDPNDPDIKKRYGL